MSQGNKKTNITVEEFRTLYSMVKEIHEGLFKNVVDGVQRTANNAQQTGNVLAFKWIEANVPLENMLYVLIDEKLIIDTELQRFCKAFSGEELTEELKIIWIPAKGSFPNKVELFYLLKTLVEKNLINDVFPTGEGDATKLYETIKKVFIDMNGKPFVNIKNSYSTFKESINKVRKSESLSTIVKKVKIKRSKAMYAELVQVAKKHSSDGKAESELKKVLSAKTIADKNAVKYERIVNKIIAEQI